MKRIIILLVLNFMAIVGISQEIIKDKKQVTIFWDSSFSMKDRNVDKDFFFLDDYFKKHAEAKVRVIIFNDQIMGNNAFNVSSGNWNSIKEHLSNVVNDGSTKYDYLIPFATSDQEILFFTDGSNYGLDMTNVFNSNVYIINSVNTASKTRLKMLQDMNQAKLIDYSVVVEPTTKNDLRTKDETSTIILYEGVVLKDDLPVKNVKVFLKGTDHIVKSDINGNFNINAKKGDTLVFSYDSFDSIEYILTERNRLTILFISDVEALDEIILKVEGKDKKEVEKVSTAFGLVNKSRIGYAVQSISDKEIPSSVSNVSQAVLGKFSGLSYGQNDDLSQVVIRGGSNSILSNNYGLIVIDGVPMPRSNSGSGGIKPTQSSSFIDPNNIESITVLKGLAATNRYGSLGNNGVLLITTKGASQITTDRKKDLTILNKNIYDEKSIVFDKKKRSIPYIKELSKFKKVSGAYNFYLTQRLQYLNQPEYFINVYDFFIKSDRQLSDRILSNVLELFSEKVHILKTLAYKYEAIGYHQEALQVYQRILKLKPDDSQSYLDMANSNINNGLYTEAFEMFKMITNGKALDNIDFSGLTKTITNDFRSFMRFHKQKLDTKVQGVEPKYLSNVHYDARIVLSWNNQDAEFEVQFVNPLKRFITWEHTNSNNARLKDEINKGYNTEEFHIDGDIKELKGKWIMNIKDFGSSKHYISNYFKVTLYNNFGEMIESKKVKLFTASSLRENENALTFMVD